MNQFLASAQRFFKNKNTITILGVIVILVLLYFGYSSQINSAVEPISVPTAVETIQPRTEITDDMVEMVDMPSISVTENVITSRNAVVGKYSNVNTVIPAGSMFYTDTVVEASQLPDSVFVKVKDGEVVYNFDVDTESTYGNSIYPGNKIDIYMKTGDGTEERVMIGKLVENIEVLAVKDSAGRDVFENTSESRSPSMLIFGVPEEIHLLLRKASYMESLGVELFPVPHGGSVASEGATEVSTQQLVDYIDAHSVNIPIAEEEETDELLPTFATNENNPNRITITFPNGCGDTYTCTYALNDGESRTTSRTSQNVNITASGTLTATVTEEDGTAHTATQEVTFSNAG